MNILIKISNYIILTILIDDLTKLFDFQDSDPVIPRQHDRVHLYVIETGFYEISQLRRIHLNHALITALISDEDMRHTLSIYMLVRWHQHSGYGDYIRSFDRWDTCH